MKRTRPHKDQLSLVSAVLGKSIEQLATVRLTEFFDAESSVKEEMHTPSEIEASTEAKIIACHIETLVETATILAINAGFTIEGYNVLTKSVFEMTTKFEARKGNFWKEKSNSQSVSDKEDKA